MADPGPSPREAKQVPCPQCGTATPFGPANRWRPFCSERCRNIDLGAWASGSYRVPAAPQDGGEAGTPELPAGDGHPS